LDQEQGKQRKCYEDALHGVSLTPRHIA
jgi:hypothetical protein